jgi:hypothetical protein
MRRDVEQIFNSHLDVLRKRAKEKRISFINILLAATNLHVRSLIGLGTRGLSEQQWRRRAEKELIERYRIQYYAAWANIALNKNRSETKTLATKDTDKIVRVALKIKEEQEKNLKIGRKKGAAASKRYSIESKELARLINNDLLKHLNTARWGLDKRADHIKIKFEEKKRMKSKNSTEEYSITTIKDWITGT